jgi:hypothetical protein
MRNFAEQLVVPKETHYDRRTSTSINRRRFYSVVPRTRALRKPVLVFFHRFRRPESVPVWINELVPDDVRPSKIGTARVVTTCLERLMDHPTRRNQ